MSDTPVEAADQKVEPLTTRTVTIGETTFTFKKMLPLDGFHLFEQVRVTAGNVGQALAMRAGIAWESAGTVTIGELIGAVPMDVFESIRRRLFREVTFTRPNIPTPRVLGDAEEAAFDGLEPTHIYEVFLRAFAVNFSPSYAALLSRLPAEMRQNMPLLKLAT